ncbi:MAG TPA: hypothetical protein VIP70_08765 [Nitrososphaeraceae archaeon]
MTSTSYPHIERYISIKLSESQYRVLRIVSKVKAMSIDQYCQWALRKGLEADIELHFANSRSTKAKLLDGLQNKDELL